MIQTGLIQSAHNDLITDAAYDFYGLRLATCSLDQRIKIWLLDEGTGTWSVDDDWKAHDAPVSKLSWAHPEFGSIIASASFDRTVKVWEEGAPAPAADAPPADPNGSGDATRAQTPLGQSPSRWIERAVLLDARGTVRAVEFAPHKFGLKLATISTDNCIRVYECLEQPSLTTWQLAEEIDVQTLPASVSPSLGSRAQTLALATPTQTSAPLEGPSVSLVAQALQQGLQQGLPGAQGRLGLGSREADGGWAISWCKEPYWGEIIAAACGISGTVKLIQLSPSRRPTVILNLDPQPHPPALAADGPTGGAEPEAPAPYAITSVAWAPSCGRSYHLIATGGRDGRVRIWRVRPAAVDADADDPDAGEDTRWSASVVADFDQHRSAVGRVEWNVTGTVLSSAGNDGRIRLWKATAGNVWRPAGSIGVEQAEDETPDGPRDDKDVDMTGD